jgi:hypothetical protein
MINEESAESIRTSDQPGAEPFVWVVDGQYDPDEGSYEPEYHGFYKVRVKQLLPAFYHSVYETIPMENMAPYLEDREYWEHDAM